MTLLPVLAFARVLADACLKKGDCALDGTAGNGHDTLFLAKSVGKSGKVWAFDIQPQALENTAARLHEAGEDGQVELILAGHEKLSGYVNRPLAAAIFNFGWLPGGDKRHTTQANTSLEALAAALDRLKEDGILIAVLYPGHEAGRAEAAAIETWASSLPQKSFSVLKYGFVNQINMPPYLLAIEKRG